MTRRAAKVDDNQRDIVRAFRDMGASVQHLHAVGAGCPDLLIGWQGRNLLVEVKDGAKVPSARKLTPAEVEFHEAWRGQVCIVETVDDAARLLADPAACVALARAALTSPALTSPEDEFTALRAAVKRLSAVTKERDRLKAEAADIRKQLKFAQELEQMLIDMLSAEARAALGAEVAR